MKKLINFACIVFTTAIYIVININIMKLIPTTISVGMYFGVALLLFIATFFASAFVYGFIYTLITTFIDVDKKSTKH